MRYDAVFWRGYDHFYSGLHWAEYPEDIVTENDRDAFKDGWFEAEDDETTDFWKDHG